MSIPINQVYHIKRTLAERPALARRKRMYEHWAKSLPHYTKAGRSYDCAVAMQQVDFAGKTVCELGARDSIFGAYLTQWVSTVHVSDIFTGWGDLGDEDHWRAIWKQAAFRPGRLQVATVDMRDIQWPDGLFDVVISFSAIEHIKGDGDIAAACEMARICKPGGKIIIGTEMSDRYRVHGGHYYDEDALFARIIVPTGCELDGEHDFAWNRADKQTHRSGAFEMSSCIFALSKGW